MAYHNKSLFLAVSIHVSLCQLYPLAKESRKLRIPHLAAGPSEFQVLHSPQQKRKLDGHKPVPKCLDSKMTHVISTHQPHSPTLLHGVHVKWGSPWTFGEE